MIIPGFSKYDITEDGIVTEAATGRVLTQHTKTIKSEYVYKRVAIVDDAGCKKQISVIKLMAITYLGIPQQPSVARAKDGDASNTVLANVEWVPCGSYSYWINVPPSRRKRKACYDSASIELVYDTLKELGEPISVSALSRLLDVPYSTVRYSVYALIEHERAKRTSCGVEAL